MRANSRHSYSLAKARTLWSSRTCAYYDALTDAAWSRSEFVARPLSRPWRGKLQPILAMNASRLFVAAGHIIYSYKFGAAHEERRSPPITFEGSQPFPPPPGTHRDITSIATVDDGTADNILYIGFQDGSLERATLKESSTPFLFFSSRTSPSDHPTDLIESLSASQNSLLSLTSSGHATLSVADSHHSWSSSIELNTRSWVCHLAAGRYAAFGTHSTTPLTVHSIAEDGLHQHPMALLQPKYSSQDRKSTL